MPTLVKNNFSPDRISSGHVLTAALLASTICLPEITFCRCLGGLRGFAPVFSIGLESFSTLLRNLLDASSDFWTVLKGFSEESRNLLSPPKNLWSGSKNLSSGLKDLLDGLKNLLSRSRNLLDRPKTLCGRSNHQPKPQNRL